MWPLFRLDLHLLSCLLRLLPQTHPLPTHFDRIRFPIKRRTQVVLPLHPVLLPLEDSAHAVRKRSASRRGLSQFVLRFIDCLRYPLGFWRFQGEFELERTVASGCPDSAGGFGEQEEVVKKNEKLKEELATEMSIGDLQVAA